MIPRYAHFLFFRKGTSFLTTFCVWFFRKIFLMLYSIKWPNFIVRLSSLLEILDSICIVITCYQVCDVINFVTNFSFIVKSFFCMIKKIGRNLNILRTKRAFKMTPKVFFILVKGLWVARNCLRPEGAPSTP